MKQRYQIWCLLPGIYENRDLVFKTAPYMSFSGSLFKTPTWICAPLLRDDLGYESVEERNSGTWIECGSVQELKIKCEILGINWFDSSTTLFLSEMWWDPNFVGPIKPEVNCNGVPLDADVKI